MSTINTETLSTPSNATVPVDTVVNGTAKAWVNFNGTGAVAIRRAFNVSSITDNATGDYTVNFTTAMADSSYGVSGCVQDTGGYFSTVVSLRHSAITSPTASGFRMISFGWTAGNSGVNYDSPIVNLAIFS
jgi:hypothetical protein